MINGTMMAVSLLNKASAQHAHEPNRRTNEGSSQFLIHK
jgi:hypothetical protein